MVMVVVVVVAAMAVMVAVIAGWCDGGAYVAQWFLMPCSNGCADFYAHGLTAFGPLWWRMLSSAARA